MRSVLLVDDHAVVRKGLKAILEDDFSSILVDEAAGGHECIDCLRHRETEAVVLDINLPDMNGLEVLKRIKAEWPLIPVLILSIYSEDQYGVRMMRAGASGYLAKSSAPEHLVTALQKILDGKRYLSSPLASQLAEKMKIKSAKEPEEKLSDREYQIFQLLISGKTVTEIAQQLSLSVKTISTHRKHILTKMGMQTNAELVSYAQSRDLIKIA